MKNLKQTLFALLLVFGAYSCQDDYEPAVNNPKPTENSNKIARIQFKSVNEMLAKMNELKQRGRRLKGREIIRPVDTVAGIETPIVNIDGDYLNDGIIKYEYTNISSERLIKDDDVTYYEACGYDSLVPDTTFARVLNIKGEVQVADTVYKISRHGTYYFKANLEPYFTENYSKYEQTEGTKIGDYLYLMDNVGIYRFDTFAKGRDEYAQSKDMPDDIEDSQETYTPLINKSFASEVNWNNYPIYNADAKTVIGKVWQFLFGRNKSYYYKIANKRRVRSKFFFYNYKIHSSIGAEVELQKKNTFGWSGTKADKLTLNWHHIMLEYNYPNGAPFYPSATPFTNTSTSKIPTLKKDGAIVSVFGIDVDYKILKPLAKENTQKLREYLKSISKVDIPEASLYLLYTKKKIVAILVDGYFDASSTKEIKVKFEDKWGINLSFHFPIQSSDWKSFCSNLWCKDINQPNLLAGQIRAGACLSGTWGAMSTIKQ